MKASFNRSFSKSRKIKIAIRRARTQATLGLPIIKTKHPEWVRDAVKGNFTMLDKIITETVQKKQQRNELFTRKLHEVVTNG